MTAEPVPALICAIDDQQYALPVTDILEVAALVKMTPLPEAPPEVLGVVNRQGELIPLLDMRQAMGKSAGALDLSTLFVVVTVEGIVAGLVVDDVQEVAMLPASALRLNTNSGPFVRGMTAYRDNPVLVLDIAALLRAFAPSDFTVESNT